LDSFGILAVDVFELEKWTLY